MAETIKVKKLLSKGSELSLQEFTILQTYCIIKKIDYEAEKTSASTLTDGYVIASLTTEQINELFGLLKEVTTAEQDYLLL